MASSVIDKVLAWALKKFAEKSPKVYEIHNNADGYLLFTSPDRSRITGAVSYKQEYKVPKEGDLILSKEREFEGVWTVSKIYNYGVQGTLPNEKKKVAFMLDVEGPLEVPK